MSKPQSWPTWAVDVISESEVKDYSLSLSLSVALCLSTRSIHSPGVVCIWGGLVVSTESTSNMFVIESDKEAQNYLDRWRIWNPVFGGTRNKDFYQKCGHFWSILFSFLSSLSLETLSKWMFQKASRLRLGFFFFFWAGDTYTLEQIIKIREVFQWWPLLMCSLRFGLFLTWMFIKSRFLERFA